jgi:hypothetical protein
MSADLDQHIQVLIVEARWRKLRARERCAALKGDDGIRRPSRGRIQSNGHACIRWHFWQGAKERHRSLGRLIKELITLRRKMEGGGR